MTVRFTALNGNCHIARDIVIVFHDFRVVHYVMDGKPVSRILHSRIGRLVSLGVLEVLWGGTLFWVMILAVKMRVLARFRLVRIFRIEFSF